jgi:hypothetical protein
VICTCKRFATDPQLVGHIGGRPTLRGPLQIDRAGRVFQTHMARRVSPWESRHHAPRHVTSASAPLKAGAGSAAMTSLGSQVTVWGCLLNFCQQQRVGRGHIRSWGSCAGCCAVTMVVGYRQVCDCGRPTAR